MDELVQENLRLRQENQTLRDRLAAAQQQIVLLQAQITTLQAQVADLQAQLHQDSHNSHWPSSRDKSRARTRSVRPKSEKKPGGQPGHPGQTLAMNEHPQEIIVHRPTACPHCQTALPPTQPVVATTKRQVVDLPPLQVQVTEHQAATVVCPECGASVRGDFPPDVTQPTPYGPRLKQLIVYLHEQQFIPYERCQQFCADVCGVTPSPGTLETTVHHAAQQAAPLVAEIKAALVTQPVAHFDESGFYIGGRRQWLHSVSTATLTYYAAHPQRGRAATDALAILPHFTGTAVHDNLANYHHYPCRHGLCNVHHLRDLNGLLETTPHPWQTRFKILLLGAKQAVAQARAAGLTALPPRKLAQIERLYDQLVQMALQAHAPPPAGWPQGARGRPRKPKARNLAERFAAHKAAVLAFVYDFNVPFDNNQAERDLRMLKVQQKIAGCFRSAQGAADFCTLRSYTSTIRKQGLSVWQALGSLFTNTPLRPRLSPV